MHGLLNGAHSMETRHGVLRLSPVSEDGRWAKLRLVRDGEQVWETEVGDVRSDPLSRAADVAHLDLRATVWEAGHALVVAGAARADLIELGDGIIRRTLALSFANKRSLDMLELIAVPESSVFVVLSNWRAWVLGHPTVDDAVAYESEGQIQQFRGWDSGVLRLAEYDTADPELPIVERAVRFSGA